VSGATPAPGRSLNYGAASGACPRARGARTTGTTGTWPRFRSADQEAAPGDLPVRPRQAVVQGAPPLGPHPPPSQVLLLRSDRDQGFPVSIRQSWKRLRHRTTAWVGGSSIFRRADARTMRHAAAHDLAVAAATAVALGVSACGGGSSTTSSTTTSANAPGGGGGSEPGRWRWRRRPGAPPKTRTKHRPAPSAPGPARRPDAAHLRGADRLSWSERGRAIQPAELWPVTNSWRVSDHKTFTAVYAGANPDHHGTGRLVVFRQTSSTSSRPPRRRRQGSGPVTITSADRPQRRHFAQKTGEIQFRGVQRGHRTLHLSNDTISVGSGAADRLVSSVRSMSPGRTWWVLVGSCLGLLDSCSTRPRSCWRRR
jgi:hypothetical protein